jgi:hypothetical protein
MAMEDGIRKRRCSAQMQVLGPADVIIHEMLFNNMMRVPCKSQALSEESYTFHGYSSSSSSEYACKVVHMSFANVELSPRGRG